MTFAEAIQSGFKNYVNFNGRASRSEYNYWILFVVLLSIFAIILDPPDIYSEKSGMLSNILSLALALPGIAVMIRRLHDTNKSGWNILWYLTIIGIFPVIYWLVFKPGNKKHNSYGLDPLISSQISSGSAKDDNEIPNYGQSDLNAEDELKKLKKMLGDGLINQEDYDAKKKELLGL